MEEQGWRSFVGEEQIKDSELITAEEAQNILLDESDPKQTLPKLIRKIAHLEAAKNAAEFDEYYNLCWIYCAEQIRDKWGTECHFLGQMVRYLNPKNFNSIRNGVKNAALAYTFNTMNPVQISNSASARSEVTALVEEHKKFGNKWHVSFDEDVEVDGDGFLGLTQDIYDHCDESYVVIDHAKNIDDRRLGEFLMSRLSRKERELIELRVYHEMTFQQIADELGISSADAADKRWRRLLKKMKKMAVKRGQGDA